MGYGRRENGSSEVRMGDGRKDKKVGPVRAVGGPFAWRNLLDWGLWREVGWSRQSGW